MKEKEHGRELSLQECQQISFAILCDVAEFCERHNIKYYLACGTLLGAIRHSGFIPWDDDVDIMMPRPDYNKFISTYHSDKYELLKPDSGMFYYTKVYDSSTIKIENSIDYKKNKPLGVDIDIFPLDGIENNESTISRIMDKSNKLETLLRLSNQPIFYRKNPIKAINRIIPRILGSRNIIKMIEKNAQSFDYEKTEYIGRIRNSSMGFSGIMRKDEYDNPIKKTFEDKEFFVPKEYDKWLSNFFGDYMQLPPEEKRYPHHDCKCYVRAL